MAGDEKMIQEIPLPDTEDSEDSEYFAAAVRGELIVQVCGACGKSRFPARPMCPYCQSTERRWEQTSGTGTIYSYVIPHPPLLPAFMPWAPYNVITVTLDGHPTIRLVGNLLPEEGAEISAINEPDAIVIGTKVRAVFDSVADDVSLVRWVKA